MPKKRLETVLVSRKEGVVTITLNRPDALNAMSPQLMEELGLALDEVAEDEGVRAVVITGAGRAFCAGGDVGLDVAHISAMTPFQYRHYVDGFSRVILKITEMEKPVIAAVNGIAVGGGCDLAMACDIRIASEETKLGSAYVRMGLVPELGGSFFLPRLVGVGMAKLLTFTGDFIAAREAERIGLVEKVVPASELQTVVSELAQRLAHGPTKTIALTKLAIDRCLNLDLRASLDYVKTLTPALLQTHDHKEAFTAFMEKRKPVFQGK